LSAVRSGGTALDRLSRRSGANSPQPFGADLGLLMKAPIPLAVPSRIRRHKNQRRGGWAPCCPVVGSGSDRDLCSARAGRPRGVLTPKVPSGWSQALGARGQRPPRATTHLCRWRYFSRNGAAARLRPTVE
jgi:hypothetical protein